MWINLSTSDGCLPCPSNAILPCNARSPPLFHQTPSRSKEFDMMEIFTSNRATYPLLLARSSIVSLFQECCLTEPTTLSQLKATRFGPRYSIFTIEYHYTLYDHRLQPKESPLVIMFLALGRARPHCDARIRACTRTRNISSTQHKQITQIACIACH